MYVQSNLFITMLGRLRFSPTESICSFLIRLQCINSQMLGLVKQEVINFKCLLNYFLSHRYKESEVRMVSNKDRTLLKVIVSTKSSEINCIKKIGVIFRVAVAIRKFQRFESDRFKNSVEYNFDREAALEELRCLYAGNEGFFRQESVKLFYFIRKFSLTFDDLNSIEGEHLARATLLQCMYEFLEDVCKHNGADGQRPVYFLCLSLKYLTRNSSSAPLNISSIVKLIGICNSSVLATELVALLAHVIEKTGNVLGEAQSAELENLVLNLPELSQEAKAF